MGLKFVVIESSPNAKDMLKKPCADVSFPLTSDILQLISDMKKKMLDADGVGLAANQVGHAIRLVMYHVPLDALSYREDASEVVPVTVLINPSYTPIKEEGIFSDWEGCFSVDETVGKVPRYRAIQYEGMDVDGKQVRAIARGFLARVIQHEIDHVNGFLILDRLTPDCIQGSRAEMMKLRKIEMEEHIAAEKEHKK